MRNEMYIKVEVMTEAKSESIEKKSKDSFVVSVREKAEQNLANRRVLEIIRREFDGKDVSVKIVNGHRQSHKILSVRSIF